MRWVRRNPRVYFGFPSSAHTDGSITWTDVTDFVLYPPTPNPPEPQE